MLTKPSRLQRGVLPTFQNASRVLVAVCAPCLLVACASNNVVTKPVGVEPINSQLMVLPRKAACTVPRRERYDVAEISARATCLASDRDAHRARLAGLQRAVRVRENTTRAAIATAKK